MVDGCPECSSPACRPITGGLNTPDTIEHDYYCTDCNSQLDADDLVDVGAPGDQQPKHGIAADLADPDFGFDDLEEVGGDA